MDDRPARSTISILRTVLHLLADDPSIRTHSETALEFKRVTLKLIAEIQADHGFAEPPSADVAGPDTRLKAIRDLR